MSKVIENHAKVYLHRDPGKPWEVDDLERDLARVAGEHPRYERHDGVIFCQHAHERYFHFDSDEGYAAHVAAEQMRMLRDAWGLREEAATLLRWVDSDPTRYWNHLTPDGPELVRELAWEQKSRLVTDWHPTHPTEGDA